MLPHVAVASQLLWPAMQQSFAPLHSLISWQLEPVHRKPAAQQPGESATKGEQMPAADWPPASTSG